MELNKIYNESNLITMSNITEFMNTEKSLLEAQSQPSCLGAVICSACGAENSIRWEKKEIGIDDKQGSYLDLTFDFCEECGNVTKVYLS